VNEEHDIRNQAKRLRGRFKQTGLVDPREQAWRPTPTAGDYVRALTQEIVDERDEEMPVADERSRSLWNSKPVQPS
jgi:hypothetical protein